MSRALTVSWLLWPLVLTLAVVPACGGSYQTGDEQAMARAEAGRRLMGDWVLVSFQPDNTLEPMLASLLTAQFGNMIVHFDGQSMVANGAGVRVQRRYRVTQADGDQLALVNYDDNGIAYDAVGMFHGNELWFSSLTDPWRGRGILRRAR